MFFCFIRFWGLKYLIVFAGIVSSFFIAPGSFSHIWMICGMIGGFIYLILQFVQVLDSAHSLAESWLDKWEQTEDKKWQVESSTSISNNYLLK